VFLNGFHPVAITSGAGGGWSVADEAIFYLCLPFLFARIKSLKTALIWTISGWVIGYNLSQFLGTKYPDLIEYFQFFSFSVEFPVFLMGIVGYFTWKELITRADDVTKRYTSLMLLGVTGVLYWQLLPFTNKTLYASSLVCLMLVVALSLHPWPLFVNRYTRLMGRISFSLYLIHFYFLDYIQDRIYQANITGRPQLALAFFGTLLFATPVAYATWRWVEEPGIRLGRRVIAKLEGQKLKRKDTELVPSGLSALAEGNSPDAQF
jgi:peptidoglycan/LPS O-acetylase OafA/YrhL